MMLSLSHGDSLMNLLQLACTVCTKLVPCSCAHLSSPKPFSLSETLGRNSLPLSSSKKNAPLSLSNHSSPHSHSPHIKDCLKAGQHRGAVPFASHAIRVQRPVKGHPNLSTVLQSLTSARLAPFFLPLESHQK